MNRFILFFILLLSSFFPIAQQSSPTVIAASGKTSKTNSIQIDWTLGELAVSTISGQQNSVSQGFHQPQYVITAIEQIASELGIVELYPNPTADILNINLIFHQSEKVKIFLSDLTGKIFLERFLVGEKINEVISLRELPAGNYFLQLKIGDKAPVATHKILKIN